MTYYFVLNRDSEEVGELHAFEKLYIDAFLTHVDVKTISFKSDLVALDRCQCLIFVGFLPDEAVKLKPFHKIIHLIIDKYLVQSKLVDVLASHRNIDRILDALYAKVIPDLIIVNNSLMKMDFEHYFHRKNLDVFVESCPHPLSAYNEKTYLESKRLKTSINKRTGCFLIESAAKLNGKLLHRIFGEAIAQRILFIPYFRQKEIAEALSSDGLVLSLLNLRISSIGFKFIFTKKGVKYLRDYFLWVWPNFLKVPSKSNNERPFQTINSRWKPSTKLGTAIALNLPLTSPAEYSLVEFAKEINFQDLYIYEHGHDLLEIAEEIANKTDYSDCKRKLQSSIDESIRSLLSRVTYR